MAIKRLHYFDHQFLVEKDFTDEQAYHLGMRRRLNRLLYAGGIAEGLQVVRKNASTITVQHGTAIDDQGQEIILETDSDSDLSDRTKFPAGATVAVGILYQEQQTDPTTATGVTGNTRVTEQAVIEVKTGAPSPGAVLLARFQLAAGSGDVPTGSLDGGVRKSITPRTGLGVASINGVTNPGGDIALVASPPSAISVTPDITNRRVLVAENHSARTDNPHATTAAQVGALLASDFFFGKRTVAVAQFTQADANGATRTINTPAGLQPRYVFAFGSMQMALGGRNYGGGTFGLADLASPPTVQQFCTGFGVSKFSNTDWLVRPVDAFGVGSALAYGIFFSSETAPAQSETLTVSVGSVAGNSMTVTLGRTITAGANAITAPNSFAINTRLFIFG